MEFGPGDHNIITPIRLKRKMINELEARMLLYFTGRSRSSADIIKSQSELVHGKKVDALDAMHKIKNEAHIFKKNLLLGDFDGMADCLIDGWKYKKQTSNLISNSGIDQIFDAAMQTGANAGKVSGAGGGGFIMFFVPVEKGCS